MRWTPSGSNVAARPSGVGKTVAPNVVKPVRHSSWAIAGSLSRVRAIRSFCSSARRRAPSTGSTGLVPSGRVMWPIPCSVASSNPAGSANASCIGATLPEPSSAPTHTLPSCASFSSSVISASNASTRSGSGRDVSVHGIMQGSYSGGEECGS